MLVVSVLCSYPKYLSVALSSKTCQKEVKVERENTFTFVVTLFTLEDFIKAYGHMNMLFQTKQMGSARLDLHGFTVNPLPRKQGPGPLHHPTPPHSDSLLSLNPVSCR